VWKATRIASITHLIGHRIVLKKSIVCSALPLAADDEAELRDGVLLVTFGRDVIDATLSPGVASH